MVTAEKFVKDSYEERYIEIQCHSFVEAVDSIKESDLSNSRFCLVDIDGTLITNPFIKMPIISHLANTDIELQTEESFLELTEIFDQKNLCLITNRNDWERIFWNSHKVLDSARELLKKGGISGSIITALNKQIPGIAKHKCDDLICRIGEYAVGRDVLTLSVIEDFSYVSLNRSDFLVYIARRVEEELGIEVNILNYVIRT